MYFQTGQVIFVSEWPNGEFVSILASICVWTKSLVCVKMLPRDFTIQKCFKVRRISVPCQPSGRSSHPVRTPIYHCSIRPDDVPYRLDSRQTKHHPSGRRVSPSGPSTVSRRFYPACIRSDVSAVRPDASQYSNSLRFFPSSNKGKIDQSSGRCGIPSRRASP
jgi:hypothetical protein